MSLDEGKKIGQRLDFAKMNNLEYLDMVVHETVRMHPTVPILWRVCTKEYHTTVRGRPLSIYKARLPDGYSQSIYILKIR